MPTPLHLVLFRSPNDNPRIRELEDGLLSQLRDEAHLAVTVVPPLYDLRPNHPQVAVMRQSGDLLVFSWLYERATRWVLHGLGVRGVDAKSAMADRRADAAEPRGAESKPRRVHCVDLKNHADAGSCLRSISELIAGCESHPVEQQPPCVDTHPVGRRWYPVIDFDRCTHCMECIDFCLFGVYGVDDAERIFVEQPDQCRKGCPACSRVCPERAILFPMHKTPAIAGSEGGIAPLKLDLSQWFGGPSKNTDERRTADAERDAQLQRASDPEGARRDELDALLDSLDEFDS